MKDSTETKEQVEDTKTKIKILIKSTTETDVIDKEFLPWKLARDLGKDSYQMALRREQIIDDKFGKLITFITVIIATVAFVITNFGNKKMLDRKFVLYLLVKLEIPWDAVFALVMLLLFVILFISILGQYGFKKDYLKTSMDLLRNFEENKDDINNINAVNYTFVDQYEKIHTSLNKVLDRKSFLLNLSHIIMIIVSAIVSVIFLTIILK